MGPMEVEMGPKGANSNKQQAGGLHSISRVLRPIFPLPKALLPTKFGPPTPGWRWSAAILRLKMLKMGPWRPKWAQKGPKQPKVGPNAPKMTPDLGRRFPYVRPPYHHVFAPPNPGWRRLAATLLLKMAQNGPLEAQKGPKTAQNGPKCPQK